jgi:hypothetical protein
LLPVWGIKRNSKKVSVRFEAILTSLEKAGRVLVRDGFVWGKKQSPEQYLDYRIPGEHSESLRKPEYLPGVEVANALEELLAREDSLPEEELLRVVARHLGYSRLVGKVRSSMEAGLVLAAERGNLQQMDGNVTWVGEPR